MDTITITIHEDDTATFDSESGEYGRIEGEQMLRAVGFLPRYDSVENRGGDARRYHYTLA